MFGDPEFWVAVAFVIFVAVVVWRRAPAMVTKTLDARAKRIRDELDEARRLREEAQALLAEYQRKQRDTEREAEDIVAQAREEAELYAADARARLEELLQRRAAQAEDKIARAEAQAVADVRARASELAIAAATALIGGGLSEAKAKELISKGIEQVGRGLN
jgi:F-type H+-transporting ATPase subunit b